MEGVLTLVYLGAMFSPIIAVAAAAFVYVNHHRKDETGGKRRSVVLFLLGFLSLGVLSASLGTVAGIDVFCSVYENAQCGLGGVFFAGSLAFSLGAGVFLYLWAKHGVSRRGDRTRSP